MTITSTPELGTWETQIEGSVAAGLDFILNHFKEPLWPRTISTKATEGRQVPVYNRQQALSWYRTANFLDCRISAYPYYSTGKVRQTTIDLVMIDLDQSTFKSHAALDRALSKTLRNIKETFGSEFEPSVIWSGNGYHIYIPIESRYVLEDRPEFSKFEESSKQFLRFAESYLSNGKCDQAHNSTISFGNCMLRIPGSHNFKCVEKNNNVIDSSTQVKVVKQWDGKKARAPIYLLFGSFLAYLVDQQIKEEENQQQRRKQFSNNSISPRTTIPWIEKLIQTPIKDHRKFASYWILSRYLINVKHKNSEDAYTILKAWSMRCNGIEALSPSLREFDNRIRYDIKEAIKSGKAPIGEKLLREMNHEIYEMFFSGQ